MNTSDVITKLAEYKRGIIALFVVLLVVFFGGAFSYRGKKVATESGLHKIHSAVVSLTREQHINKEDISRIERLMRAHPEGEPRHQQALAQHLFAIGEKTLGISVAKKALARMEEHVPYYQEFSQTTLLIENEKHEQALKQAIALKEQMYDDKQLWDAESKTQIKSVALMCANLFRIAMLHKELGQPTKEKLALAALKEFVGLSAGTKESFTAQKSAAKSFVAMFSAHNYTFSDYIREREHACQE